MAAANLVVSQGVGRKNANVTEWENTEKSFRIQIRKTTNPDHADISLIGTPTIGWIGFGFAATGKQGMADADLMLCWASPDKTGAVLTKRTGINGGVTPATQNDLVLNKSQSKIYDQRFFVCRFTRPLPSASHQLTSLLWAVGDVNPNSASSSAMPSVHKSKGTFKSEIFSIVKPNLASVSGSTNSSIGSKVKTEKAGTPAEGDPKKGSSSIKGYEASLTLMLMLLISFSVFGNLLNFDIYFIYL